MADAVIVVGGGAAGLMAAISAAEAGARVRLLEGNVRPGTKILMSGGTRCNVTNETVTEKQFNTSGSPAVVRRILRAFTAEQTVAFFAELGVHLRPEPETGKLFPTTDDARTVLDALVGRLQALGVDLVTGARMIGLAPGDGGWTVALADGRRLLAPAVIVATGGRSYPTTGSDGTGLELLGRLGHRLVRQSPALTPLVLDGTMPRALMGVTLPARLVLHRGDKPILSVVGSTLITHFGLSGPAALNVSRHWERLGWDDDTIGLRAGWLPDLDGAGLEAALLEQARRQPDRTLGGALGRWLPHRFVEWLLGSLALDPATRLDALRRDDRKRLVRWLTDGVLPVVATKGYSKAEATAGGVALDEVDPSTLRSRRHDGLFLCGEVLDVDGWLGGYNFQWSWSSGRVAGTAAARAVVSSSPVPFG